MHDISVWREGDISSLNARRRKRYMQRKAAIEAYFTTDESPHNIAHRYHLRSEKVLVEMAKRCLMQHQDSASWGFRALLPGVTVVDHTSQPPSEATASFEKCKGDSHNNVSQSEAMDLLSSGSEH